MQDCCILLLVTALMSQVCDGGACYGQQQAARFALATDDDKAGDSAQIDSGKPTQIVNGAKHGFVHARSLREEKRFEAAERELLVDAFQEIKNAMLGQNKEEQAEAREICESLISARQRCEHFSIGINPEWNEAKIALIDIAVAARVVPHWQLLLEPDLVRARRDADPEMREVGLIASARSSGDPLYLEELCWEAFRDENADVRAIGTVILHYLRIHNVVSEEAQQKLLLMGLADGSEQVFVETAAPLVGHCSGDCGIPISSSAVEACRLKLLSAPHDRKDAYRQIFLEVHFKSGTAAHPSDIPHLLTTIATCLHADPKASQALAVPEYQCAAGILGNGTASKDILAVLRHAMQDERPSVKLHAAAALAMLSEQDRAQCHQVLLDANEEQIRDADFWLLHMDVSQASAALIHGLHAGGKLRAEQYRFIWRRLAERPDGARIDEQLLEAALNHADSETRVAAAVYSMRHDRNLDRARQIVGLALSDDPEDIDAMEMALYLLPKIGEDAHTTVPDLSRIVNRYAMQKEIRDLGTAERAVRALEAIGSDARPALPVLFKLLEIEDSEHFHRLSRGAFEAIRSIGGLNQEQVAQLVRILDSETAFLRYEACRALAHAGPTAKSALPKLRLLQNDPYQKTRDAVGEAAILIEAAGL